VKCAPVEHGADSVVGEVSESEGGPVTAVLHDTTTGDNYPLTSTETPEMMAAARDQPARTTNTAFHQSAL
jgi:hypothetical protein